MRLAFITFLLLVTTAQAAMAGDTTQATGKKQPIILGEVRTVESAALSEKRMLNIYLPEGYDQEDTTRYPVIYLLDGSADEDFIHICGVVQFFCMMRMMPPAIVVGIANVDRKRDFTYPTAVEKDKKDFPTTGGSAGFIRFIESELQPFVEASYKVNDTRVIIGQSLGGLLATEILFTKPALFTNYIIVSPSLWWDNGSVLRKTPALLPGRDISVFVAVGKEGRVMESYAKKLTRTLKRNEYAHVHFRYMKDEDHATILHNAVYKALLTIPAQ